VSERKIVVCSECLRAGCLMGILHCDDYKRASTVERTFEELIDLGLEHPTYWRGWSTGHQIGARRP